MNRTGILAAVLAAATTLGLASAAQAQLLGRNPIWRTGVPDCCRGGNCEAHRHGGHDRYDRRDRDHGRDRHDGRDRYDRHDRRGGLRALRRVAVRLESATDHFVRSFDQGLDRSRLNGSDREDRLNDHAKRLERAADHFKDRVHDGRVHDGLVDELFAHARRLDRFMDRARLDRRAERDWLRVEHELVAIARHFGLRGWRLEEGRGRDRGRYGRHEGRHDERRDRWDDERHLRRGRR